jgi:signal peptide peptidase SppA
MIERCGIWLASEQALGRLEAASAGAIEGDMPNMDVEENRPRADNVAVVPVHGALSRSPNHLARMLGMATSTVRLEETFRELKADASVDKVVLDVDSPGGKPTGIPEATDALRDLASEKEVASVATGQMASAAYWLGSAANRIYATEAAHVGSIGVRAVLINQAGRLEEEGFEVKVIRTSEMKARPNAVEQFTEKGVSVIEERAERLHSKFVSALSENLDISEETVEEDFADGRVHLGEQAAEIGLVDEVASLHDVIEAARLSEDPFSRGITIEEARGHVEQRIDTLESRIL